ncbi:MULTISPECIES: Imm49 family immunity protein [unclassified Streptomyces]|nr:Imm49 family immunity protein [Streptomyces sp. NBC_01260]
MRRLATTHRCRQDAWRDGRQPAGRLSGHRLPTEPQAGRRSARWPGDVALPVGHRGRSATHLGSMDQRHAGQLGSLEKALRAHKAYWTTDQERADSCYGWVALAPLAMACLALDADFSIEIESDYMPGHLLRATWAGEFPT